MVQYYFPLLSVIEIQANKLTTITAFLISTVVLPQNKTLSTDKS